MKLGLQLGYWGQMPSPDWVDRAVAAEELGFTSVWTAIVVTRAIVNLIYGGRQVKSLSIGNYI